MELEHTEVKPSSKERDGKRGRAAIPHMEGPIDDKAR
jgi:hypothetical protein